MRGHSKSPVAVPRLPTRHAAPKPGRWVWTCRGGFEAFLYEELVSARAKPTLLGPALVEAAPFAGAPPVFGRAGFAVLTTFDQPPDAAVVAGALRGLAGNAPLAVQSWALDTPEALTLANSAEALEQAVRGELGTTVDAWGAAQRGGILGQVCWVSRELIILGGVAAHASVSLAPGGRQRMHRGSEAPSRAALKLDEALAWVGISPGAGDACVDLGAAPGGWSSRLASAGARVIAVDPAELAPAVKKHPKVRHVKDSAFRFAPQEPAEWLFCDMAWRPLEVAQLLAKWGRNRWATHLVANIKLPMKDKTATLRRVREVLEANGAWQHVRMRQLYHDRDEVTVSARAR